MFASDGTRVKPAAALARSAALWLDRKGAFRKKAIEALTVSTGFSAPLVEMGIDNAFRVVTPKALASVKPARESRILLIVCPSNVFTAWLPPAVLALASGHSVWLKPSVHEPVFPKLWRESVEMVDPSLAERIKEIPWRKSIYEAADAVVAYGSDEAVAQLKEACGNKPFIGFGHQVSVGILFCEALEPKRLPATREAIAHAVEPFRLQGCLSPIHLFIQSDDVSLWRRRFESPAPFPRLEAFHSGPELLQKLSSIPDRLACIGWEGNPRSIKPLQASLTRLGVHRICPLGEMQSPPLSWANGGIDLVEWLKFRTRSSIG